MMSLSIRRRGLIDEYKGYNFRRESMALDSAGKLIYPHNARFEQGPFGSDKAILVEEGTENLYRRHYDTMSCSIVDEASDFHHTVQLDTAIYSHLIHSNVVVSEDVITLSYEMRVIQGTSVQAIGYLRTTDNVVNTYSSHTSEDIVEVGEDWTKVSMTVNLSSTNKELSRLSWLVKNPTGQVVEVRNIQLEQKPYATTFTPSVRANEEIIIPTAGLLSPEQGTIEFDFKVPISPTETGMFCFLLRNFYIHSANGFFYFFVTGAPRFYVSPPINEWNRLALVYENNDLNTVVLFLNGNRYEISDVSPDNTSLPNWWTTINIPARFGGNSATKYISNFRLSSIARTQEQLAPLDRPPEVDEYTTLYLSFNGPDNVRKAKVVML